jgi:Permuted papain-like amidase enzyme, YaeF/YiiX, C92 family
MWTFVWCVTVLFGHDGKEPTDRLVPPSWQGNPWGPAAMKARQSGAIEPIPMTPLMKQWEAWGKAVLHDGDVVFRRADARILFGRFPFSRFIANASGSRFSHTGVVAIEDGQPVVYDTTKAGVRRQPFAVWILDNVGPLGVKRLRPELQPHAAAAVRYCRDVFERQVPFDYDLDLDDRALYCVEMTEKAFRASGLVLSQPVRLGDMENVTRYPICVFVFMKLSNLTLDQAAYFPGNERHGIWSSPHLLTIYQTPKTPPPATAPSTPKPAEAGRRTAARDLSRPH